MLHNNAEIVVSPETYLDNKLIIKYAQKNPTGESGPFGGDGGNRTRVR